MRGFELIRPTRMQDALAALGGEDPTVRAMSGGTGLMLMMKSGVFQPSALVSLADVEDASTSIDRLDDGSLRIGAMCSLSALETSAEVRAAAPMMSDAMPRLSNRRVRNVARVGGNLAHGDPHMDLPPVLAALETRVEVTGPDGTREIPVAELYSGYYETVLEPSELITAALVPAQDGWISTYTKITTRAAEDWPALGIAAALRIRDGSIPQARVFVSAATERLSRAEATEALLTGAPVDRDGLFAQAADAAADSLETVEDAQGSATYKSALLRITMRRTLERLTTGATQ